MSTEKDKGVISLHEVTRELLHEYYRGFISDPDIFMDMNRFFTYHYDPEKIDGHFALKKPTQERKEFMIIVNDTVVGEICLKHIDYDKRECELSIHMQNDSVKNKGYGTQAEKLAVCYAFEELRMNTVLADAVLKNVRSQHVLEKVGFRFVRQNETFKYYRYERETYNEDHTL
ncbi:GNAT family N-acetyltransferase [Sedimentibacter sp. zth1]|uniref:GNAT family N-acetyltransferase n=1 Tax=Sedimentibacter sp. zth1 TaxID=2816908 RepID=UPI001A91D346|nr:GNAT family N-acetyltransferase [Sedimentibacter sp. zth1]QSX05916.1 GNAT family N-acetyltransferase [Sedimentibacter sp. zth1]